MRHCKTTKYSQRRSWWSFNWTSARCAKRTATILLETEADFLDDPAQSRELYLRAIDGVGVQLVWVVDPGFETETAFAANEEPKLFTRGQELTAEVCLPGFQVRVAELLE